MIANKTAEQIRIDRERREALAKQRASMLVDGLDLYAYDNAVMCRTHDVDGNPITLALFMCESHSAAVAVILAYGKG